MRDKVQEAIDNLKNRVHLLKTRQVTIGFDGFVDCIVRVIKYKLEGTHIYFEEINEFGCYIADKRDKSCIIELEDQITKIGGNMPIMANALGNLGVKVNCIGAMGYPEIDQVFKNMSPNCNLFSVAEPGYTTALEFNDGKVMFARMRMLDNLTWERIKYIMNIDSLVHLYKDSDLIGIVNWSEIQNSCSIWEGILHEILHETTTTTNNNNDNKKKIILFDLSDCSKRNGKDIRNCLDLIKQFNRHYRVILGLNENEANIVYNVLCKPNERDCVSLKEIGSYIYRQLLIDILVVHLTGYSVAWDIDGVYKADTLYIDYPKLSTGGGDNFNAGFCIGQMLEMNINSSLVLANAVAAFYVKNGCSPDIVELTSFLNEWAKTVA